MRHVVHLSAADVYGGGEEHLRTLLKFLKEHEQKEETLSLICPSQAPLAEKVKELNVPVYPLSFGGKKDPLAVWRLRQLIQKIKGTHVHSHNRREDLAAILGLSPFKVKRITTLHDRVNMTQGGERSQTFFDRVYLKILPRFDRVLAVSQATLDDYQQLTGDRRASNQIITNGMDLSRINSLPVEPDFREKYQIPQDSLLVAISARVRQGEFGKKGHLRFLEALAKTKSKIHLLTLGEDAFSQKILIEQARNKGIGITCLGFVSDALPFLAQADVVALPSLFEGLPRSLMEAMALGKPVMGSDVDGIAILLDHGRAGCLLPVDDPQAWAQALDQWAHDPQKRKDYGQRARERIHSQFDAKKMAQEHWQIYREK